jgi:hypothetical protein
MTDTPTPTDALNEFIQMKAQIVAEAIQREFDIWFPDEFEERWGVQHLRSHQGMNDPSHEIDAYYDIETQVWDLITQQAVHPQLNIIARPEVVDGFQVRMRNARRLDGNE